jgi:hypothetical protein
MRINRVDFPEILLTAQKNGHLVIFAGAGVSISPPSNFPNFNGLVERVAAGTLERLEAEPPDHFLGRLHKQGVNVHKRTVELLTDPLSKPNSLHYDLLKLFPFGSRVRLVTTNFDAHFTTGASELFPGVTVESFHAPALPLGHSFSGIVYLHGFVKRPPESLVLTDSDFGRAYLTEGWARRFLQTMFAEYTVLFVGYSHDDVVLQYLARGLPPKSSMSRFALAEEAKQEHWRFLDVTPLPYPTEDNHRVLSEALAAWAEHCQKGALDHEYRIRGIVAVPPSLEPEENDYVENSLRDPTSARFFTRYANTVDWLRWVEERGFLE